MNVELKVNGNMVYASDCPTSEEWKWQDRYNQCRAYLERLARTEAVPEAHRQHITAWISALEAGTLQPPFPTNVA